MSDYRVTVRVRNARLLRALEAIGHNPSSFAKAHGFSATEVCALAAMKLRPQDRNGDWRPVVVAICEATNTMPVELFNGRQLRGIDRNVVERELDEAALVALTGHTASSEDHALTADARRLLGEALSHLPDRLKTVVQMRAQDMTLEEVARELGGLSRERIRQMEARAHREMRQRLKKHQEALTNLDWNAA